LLRDCPCNRRRNVAIEVSMNIRDGKRHARKKKFSSFKGGGEKKKTVEESKKPVEDIGLRARDIVPKKSPDKLEKFRNSAKKASQEGGRLKRGPTTTPIHKKAQNRKP